MPGWTTVRKLTVGFQGIHLLLPDAVPGPHGECLRCLRLVVGMGEITQPSFGNELEGIAEICLAQACRQRGNANAGLFPKMSVEVHVYQKLKLTPPGIQYPSMAHPSSGTMRGSALGIAGSMGR